MLPMKPGDLVTITGHIHDSSPTAHGRISGPDAQRLDWVEIEKGTTGVIINHDDSAFSSAILLDDGRVVWFFIDDYISA